VDIINACVVQHNFFLERVGYKFQDALTVTGLAGVPESAVSTWGLTGNNGRNKVTEYFLTDSRAFSQQMSKVLTV
jgi:hypothetical protein